MVNFIRKRKRGKKKMRHRMFWRRVLVLAYMVTTVVTGASFSEETYAVRDWQIREQQMQEYAKMMEEIEAEYAWPEPVSTLKPVGYVTADSDLAVRANITVEDINKLIDVYTEYHPNSAFKGTANAFMQASQETGYDPIFLFSLAGLESGWNVSPIHGYLNNPYSIGMIDTNIWNGWKFDTFEDGIISGAHVIYDLWYAVGKVTLNQMEEKPFQYATDDTWATNVAELMSECYEILGY